MWKHATQSEAKQRPCQQSEQVVKTLAFQAGVRMKVSSGRSEQVAAWNEDSGAFPCDDPKLSLCLSSLWSKGSVSNSVSIMLGFRIIVSCTWCTPSGGRNSATSLYITYAIQYLNILTVILHILFLFFSICSRVTLIFLCCCVLMFRQWINSCSIL